MIYGLEEEVFVLEPDRPTVRSLYFLARLLWQDPAYYYTHSASNFARGSDLVYGLVSGVEVSTEPHDNTEELVQDLTLRRRDLARASQGYVCPIGSLPEVAAPTNTCGLHLHISGTDMELAYRRLARYLPAFALALAHAPHAGGRRFGQSFRWAHSYALGPLRPDPTYRFQDVILTRRLGTLEVRLFDPSPDTGRLGAVLACLDRLMALPPGRSPADHFQPDATRHAYNHLRQVLPRLPSGQSVLALPSAAELIQELADLAGFDAAWVAETPADTTARCFEQEGFTSAYGRLDAEYRRGAGAPAWDGGHVPLVLGAAAGFAGYYLPKLPFVLWKAWREWH